MWISNLRSISDNRIGPTWFLNWTTATLMTGCIRNILVFLVYVCIFFKVCNVWNGKVKHNTRELFFSSLRYQREWRSNGNGREAKANLPVEKFLLKINSKDTRATSMQVTLMSLLVTLNKHFPLVPLISSSPDSILNNLRLIFSCTDLLLFDKKML